jgi:phage gpG-like protein
VVTGFVSYEVDNDNRFKSALEQAIKSVDNLRFAMGEISRDIYKTTKQNFILKGYGQYPALSPKYAKYKNMVRPGKPILVFDGHLRDSVTAFGNSDSVRAIGKNSLIQGTNVGYARYIQEGTKKMPARKYLFIDDAQELRFERILADYVAAKLEVLGDVK